MKIYFFLIFFLFFASCEKDPIFGLERGWLRNNDDTQQGDSSYENDGDTGGDDGDNNEDYFITIIEPNGGESWIMNENKNIKWQTNALNNINVGIELHRDNSNVLNIITSTSNDGNYNWTIPSSLFESNLYKIRIYLISNDSIADYSDGYFSINSESVSSASITVISPNGGEQWEYFSTQTILWESANLSGSWVDIYLYKDGEPYKTISGLGTPDDGSYDWGINSTYDLSDLYQIVIQSESDVDVFDSSDNFFSIINN